MKKSVIIMFAVIFGMGLSIELHLTGFAVSFGVLTVIMLMYNMALYLEGKLK